MKKLLLFFVFINSYWTFGQLTYSFDAEYYSCGNYYSQYCQPNTTITSTGFSEPFNVFSWSFGNASDDYHRGSKSSTKKITSTIAIDYEFILTTNYDYDNSFYTLDAKPPGRAVYEPSCGYCDYKKDYANEPWNNPGGARYYSESRGRIFFQGRYINWNYEAYREPQNTSGTADTQDFLSVKIPMTRMAGSNCYDSDYCVECSVVTGGIAYDSADDTPDGQIILSNFRPNDLVISKPGYNPYATGVYTPPEILAGETFDLIASTPSVNTTMSFPDFVYHWQYRPEGSQSWEDVPNTVINTLQTNNTPRPVFTMRDLPWAPFGAIDFRLGYGPDDRAFTTAYRIIYKPGAPVITNIEYVPPKCNGNAITSIDVYFNRDLVSGESFSLFRIVPFPKVSGDAVRFSQPEIKNLIYDPIKDQYKYSFIIPTSNNTLENNKKYVVEYQAALNGVPKGTMAEAQPFLYQDPEELTFSIVPTDPLCHNGEGGLTLNVKGGSGVYSYSLDDGTAIPFTVTTVETSTTTNNITTISRTASQPIILPVTDTKKSYKIKVTDKHGCIEKTL
ncbi:SprB repeat-containing protein [Flavobacterium fluviatile]|uniref:SprB repeat-containing protein n=1 Tax=Flavobacterium fluviatile TaxID=1862387 RepID=UPI0013D058C3|nr:SprB repeat-containing protein [Flavobacterium fluviatile]